MKMISVEKPGSPEELVHYGVKGMRWGHRRHQSGPPAVTKTKGWKAWQNASQKNVDAHNKRRSARTAARKASGKPSSDDIQLARARNNMRYTKIVVAKTHAEREKAKKAYLNSPDRATARRLTTGEKVVFGVMLALPPTTIPAGLVLGTNLAIRKGVERKQARR
jgi:hypothetical protein